MASLNATSKFKVFDPPGFTQPPPPPPPTTTVAIAAPPSPSKGSKGSSATQGSRTTESSAGKMSGVVKIGGPFKRAPNPMWLKDRDAFYNTVKASRDAEKATKTRQPITVTMPDGNVLSENKKGEKFMSWETSPIHVAAAISQGLADSCVVAKVTYADRVDYDAMEQGDAAADVNADATADNDVVEASTAELWDLTRPLVGNVAKLEFLKFEEDKEAKTVFWHSSAHILGEALEHQTGAYLTIGPPLNSGFYYDSYMGDNSLTEDDYKGLEAEVGKVTKAKQQFERLVVTKEEALQLFKYNPFKVEIITSKVPDGTRTTVYRCGDLIDLCRGPHLPHTGKVKAFACTSHSATQWLAKDGNDQLQRMYGISFPDKKMLKAWQENMELAKARDHRVLGTKQNLFMFHDLSPGSCFFLPHGARIYNKLMEFIKEEYWKRGYDEVITPNMFNLDLWHQSGHAMHYRDGMFIFDVEGAEWGMKPMNCPGHCLIFGSTVRSYRDLPMRFADFGVLHRNELSGALTGLTRVRRFVQDDAHIYCREDQVEAEVIAALEFMKYVYDIFGMSYKLELSTRPAKALGDVAIWDRAEKALANAMNTFAGEGNWRENPGDGAFYGPKIDIKVSDSMDRVHQCATIQLDFQLPIRFDLKYKSAVQAGEEGGAEGEEKAEKPKKEKFDKKAAKAAKKALNATKDEAKTEVKTEEKNAKKEFVVPNAIPKAGFERPVMVHRAMLGSVERMFAVLCEHYGGKWPFWMSPRQVMLVPVHNDQFEYCETIKEKLHDLGFYAECDLSKNTFPKKVRNAQVDQWNYQLVVGKEEMANGTVNIRTRANEQKGEMKLEEFYAMCTEMKLNRSTAV